MATRAYPEFEQYEALGRLGVGGPYRVRRRGQAGLLVLKAFAPGLIASEEARRRFEEAAARIAAADHPHLARLVEAGVQEQGPFMILEYVEGLEVGGVLAERGCAPLRDAVRLGREAASALAHLHERGIVHGAVKPSNIIRRESDGRYLLTDFSHALAFAASAGPGPAPADPRAAAADQYGLGAVLYEVLAGSPLAEAAPEAEPGVPEPDVRRLRPEAPDWLAELVARCLAPRASDRWPDMRALEQALASGEAAVLAAVFAGKTSAPEAPSAEPAALAAQEAPPEAPPERQEAPEVEEEEAPGVRAGAFQSDPTFGPRGPKLHPWARSSRGPSRRQRQGGALRYALIGAAAVALLMLGALWRPGGLDRLPAGGVEGPARPAAAPGPAGAPAQASPEASANPAPSAAEPPADEAAALFSAEEPLTVARAGKLADYYLALGSRRDTDHIDALYGERVEYFSQGIVRRAAVARDKRNYQKRWPMRSYGRTSEVEVVENGGRAVLKFDYRYDVGRETQQASGEGWAQLTLEPKGDRWVIVGEKGGVTRR